MELASHNIQVNAIIPGWIPTEVTQGVPESPRGEEIRCYTPAGRWGKPEDLVGAAVFLSSAAYDFVTGTSIAVDGGYLITERNVRRDLEKQ